VATLLSFAAWVFLIVLALRRKQFGWAIMSFLLWPVSGLYLILHAWEGPRARRLLLLAALVSPLLLLLLGFWAYASWYDSVLQSRLGPP
jgi:hypothetical protein